MENRGSEIKVEFNREIHGNQISVYQWLTSTGRNPSDWEVFRDDRRLNHWDPVNLDEILFIRPVKKK